MNLILEECALQLIFNLCFLLSNLTNNTDLRNLDATFWGFFLFLLKNMYNFMKVKFLFFSFMLTVVCHEQLRDS